MNYQETVNWMFNQLPMFQRDGQSAYKKDLTNILAFSKVLDYPEQRFKSIHVAGTNGKGSTSHMLASILQEAGYKVGLYTSPHLKSFTERIKINGKEIRESNVVTFIEKHKDFLEKEKLSFFEMTVGMAFDYFAQEKVDIAVIEVGLGGRLDSTNIVTPEVSVITNIGFDHTQFLGDTYASIATEKAGIIKKDVPVVIGESHVETKKVFLAKTKLKEAPIYFAEKNTFKDYPSDLKGSYQKKNIKTVLTTIEVLKTNNWVISEESIQNGIQKTIKNTGLRGRWDVLGERPLTITDTAHNREGLKLVIEQLSSLKKERLHIVLGVVNDKDLDIILPLFPSDAQYYFCRPHIPRGLSEVILQDKALVYGLKGSVYSSVNEALLEAKNQAQEKDIIFIGGSTFTVAEII
ncbi:folylpolyglutamate synthase/dihydrofolate synthase family protein [Mesonia sp. K7]|uniref:bifunctional folylpolyglutamate synthase/dihydrofolate synthase n=1 Tax=Mesonia sp. K7 TaxID=2218606 RepID=UPI000DAA0E7C|nr:folylpolyglutamate synthase/dihydrofolate synthase family protein [Mesonia sp. K7]PZD77154.1 bifunctional folylpolyglutamate synthase/dihydrofolate synthase [Mesonia sp. K7]